MVDLSFYVGVIGNIISLLMFLSPTSTFKRIIEHKSTEGFESVPYICTLLSSSLWTYYGLIKPEYLVSTINGFGVFVQFIFVILFLIYAPRPMKVKTWSLVGILNVGFFGAAIIVPKLTLKPPNQVDALGLLCAGLNVVMYGSPLTAMVPNGIGCFLGGVQLVLYAIYRNAKPSKSDHLLSQSLLEEGSQQPILNSSSSHPTKEI